MEPKESAKSQGGGIMIQESNLPDENPLKSPENSRNPGSMLPEISKKSNAEAASQFKNLEERARDEGVLSEPSEGNPNSKRDGEQKPDMASTQKLH